MVRTERRVVTVLFADLVGFTTLAEQLDAEDVALVQDRYFAAARAAVTAAGGEVEKFVGDAVMAVFGVPEVHDDDAARAVRAGLAVVDAVARVGADLDLPAGTLQVRVGVNTGEVLVTLDEDGAGSWRLSGDAVNLAARLQTAADPGSILVGADTALAVAPAYVTEPAGELSLKGKGAAVPAWRIDQARPAPSRHWALHGLHASTIGRENDLGRLEAAWHRASAGHHEAALVVAPPGVGKTRLVVEFRTKVRAAGAPVWAASAADQGPSRYEPVARLLRQALALADAGGHGGDDIRRLVLDRLEAHGLAGPRAELSADHAVALLSGSPSHLDAEPLDLWTSWTAVLDAEPGDGAPVWIMEDVHLASADLRSFLGHAVATTYRAARLVVMTARPSLLIAGDDASFGAVDIVNLEPLGGDETRRLVSSLVGEGVLPPALEATVARASGGNPLYVEELLRSWVQAGALRRDDEGAWELVGASDPAVPSTVRAIYLGQLFALPDAPRTVVETGSVPGTTFPAGALPVLGVDDPGHALDFLTGSGLLAGPHADMVDLDSYTYRHALLRDAAYGALPRARRTQLHTRFADWVAETVPVEQGAEIVGMHLLTAYEEASSLGPPGGGPSRAELAQRASAWLERAGDLSLTSAPSRAAELFSLAVQLTDPEQVSDAVRRQLRFAEALRRSGRLEDAVTVFGEAGLMADDVGDSARCLVEAATGYEDALFESRLPRTTWGGAGIALLERALAIVPAGSPQHARLLAALGRARAYGGNPAVGASLAARALEEARRAGDDGAVAYARMALRASQSSPDRLADRLAAADELVEAAARAGDAECELEGVRLHFVDLLEAGDIAAADVAQRRAEEAIDALRRPLYLWYPAMWRAMRALFAGEFAAADRLVEAFRDEGVRWRYRDVELVHAVQLLHLAVDTGHPERAVPVIEAVATVVPDRVAGVEASLLAHLGRANEAQSRLDRMAENGFAAVPDDQSRAYVLALCADAAGILGDATAAARLLSLLEPWEHHNVVLGSGAVCLGSGSLYLGIAARTAGHLDRARDLLESAVAANTAMGARPAKVRAGSELACTLWASGRRDEALFVAGSVRAEARELGMSEVVSQLDELRSAA